jgi:hypothetical protein
LPFIARIEKLPNEGLDLHLVQVGEEGLDAIDQEIDYEFFVGAKLMRGTIILIDRTHNDGAGLNSANHLLQNEALELEATDVAVVCHHCENVTNNQKVEVLIES